MSVTDVTYFDAWQRWLSGENVSSYYLWTFQIIWLGRIGKLVSFISALAVVAELIGAARLRRFGESLHGRFTAAQAMQIVREGFRPALEFLLSVKSTFGFRPKADDLAVSTPKYRMLMDEFFRTKIGLCALIAATITIIVVAYVVFRLYGFPAVVAFFFAFSFGYEFILPFMVAIFVTLLMATFVCVDFLFIETTACVLERRSLDKLIKIGALLLLIIGFHFDLLAS